MKKPAVTSKQPLRDGQLYARVQKVNENYIRKVYKSQGYKGFSAFLDDVITEWRLADKKKKGTK